MKITTNNWTEIENGKKIRSQVVLTAALKRLIESKRRLTGETLSEYLRQAALLRLWAETEEEEDLDKLADLAVGSVSLTHHPEWQTKAKLQNWVRKMRQEWD